MCNLYRARKSAAEVAAYFRADLTKHFNVGEEVYPGASGLVVIEGEGKGAVRTMTWGFPHPMKSKVTRQPIKPKPVDGST